MEQVSKRTGAKSSRSETVSIRLEPKLRYLVELSARETRRTVSAFIEWCVYRALHGDLMPEPTPGPDPNPASFGPLYFESFWKDDPTERFLKLATTRGDLLSEDELEIWKLILKNSPAYQKDRRINLTELTAAFNKHMPNRS